MKCGILYLIVSATILVIIGSQQPPTEATSVTSSNPKHQQVASTRQQRATRHQDASKQTSADSKPQARTRLARAAAADDAEPESARLMAPAESLINSECRRDRDCDDMRCYQGKCICPKERPIEDRGVCLACK
jgi:hypothetical protein